MLTFKAKKLVGAVAATITFTCLLGAAPATAHGADTNVVAAWEDSGWGRP